jgi:curved DNA-binding protein CbpA
MSAPPVERDLYERLNVDPSASPQAVRSAYRLLAHRLHPDRNAAAAAHRAMIQINHAYAVLRDPASRAAYDRERAATASSASPPRPSHKDTAGRVVLDFGRYQGWALEEIARRDVDYLEWLKRHSSGPRYRHEIDRILAALERAPVLRSQGERNNRR